jgi:3-hydroxyisobutyrate dehydrogenase
MSVGSKDSVRAGFVGIGNMGTPMAGHLCAAGWRVTVYDTDAKRGADFVAKHGGSVASTLAELGAASDVVITMLPDGKIVRRVVLGDGGDCLAKGLAKGATIIDMSSSAPVGTRELGAELQRLGIALLDAPVSGAVKGAVAGKLSIMVGGDKALAERMDPVLAAMGKRIHVGPLGSGHAAKVLNNMVSAAGMATAAEAVVVARQFGIEPQTLVDVLNASTGKNNATENKFSQYILNNAFNSGFALALMVKDLALAVEVAKACGVPADLSQACLKVWAAAQAELGSNADHTEIAKHVGWTK